MSLVVGHVAISVKDIERSLTLYRDLLGMRVIRDIPPEQSGGLGRITGLNNCSARIVHLNASGFMVELFQYITPRGRPIPSDHCQADNGFTHIGFESTDVRADWARLCQAGIHFLSEPVEFRPGVWVAYFRGPDGETCELRQVQQNAAARVSESAGPEASRGEKSA